MEVRIRLQRIGKRANKRTNYRVVAMTARGTRDGKHLDLLGYYDPSKKPATVSINHEKIERWVKQGAQMSATVRSLVNKTKKSQ